MSSPTVESVRTVERHLSVVDDADELPAYFHWKAAFDRTVAFLLLLPALPLIGCLVLLVRATSRGPGIYSQERVGRGGRSFTMYKLRTMRCDAESATGPVWSVPGHDVRVTGLGYWLRKLHLDELPQLFNVLRGEMSLIGPRPERPKFVRMLEASIPGYSDRLRVLPGVTGLAQINLPPDTELDDVRRKLVLDREYIETACVSLDCRILLCTLFRLLGLRGELAKQLLHLSRTVSLPSEVEKTRTTMAQPLPANPRQHASANVAVSRPILNAFSVDVEDYFQVSGFESHITRTMWDSFDCRVVPSTRRLLELLNRKNARGTFFVLGWIARKYPSLIHEIHQAGHEVACHGYWHQLIYHLAPEQFQRDVHDAKAAIEDAAGVAVKAFRAPSFSITNKSLWALDVLVQEGFTIDSSIFPTRHDRYGIPDANPAIHDIKVASGVICEFPPTVGRLAGVNIPTGGGGYLRLYPARLTNYLLRQVNQQDRPFMCYLHPWEVDPNQPRLKYGTRLSRFRHYVNLEHTEAKLDELLSTFSFGTVSESIAEYRGKLSLAECRNNAAGSQSVAPPAVSEPVVA